MLLCRRIPNAIEPGFVTLKPCARPARRSGPAAPAVNWRQPFAPLICCTGGAPGSKHPSQPAVLVSEPLAAVTLTGLLHVTLTGVELEPDPEPAEPELGAGDDAVPPPI